MGYGQIGFRIIKAAERVLFPTKCIVCDTFIHSNLPQSIRWTKKKYKDKLPVVLNVAQHPEEEKLASRLTEDFKFSRLFSPYLCPACILQYAPVESPICISCGIMFKSREGDDHLCENCINQPNRFQVARAPGIYDRSLMKVIHHLKYRGKIQLARPLGWLLFAAFIRFWDINQIDLVIPVPLHLRRLRQRGFNQAYLLVRKWKQLAAKLSINISDIAVERNMLVRSRWTEPQTGLEREKRMKNIKNAFQVNHCFKISEKRILLVDDVFTTGATVNECAKTLLSSGAKRVDVLTLARAM
ncbi:MAG: ComF family protein [Desulfobacterales bacterium]|nr:ComF family protein [Desulfobacterales bacterium]